jgi:hypothetical protein
MRVFLPVGTYLPWRVTGMRKFCTHWRVWVRVMGKIKGDGYGYGVVPPAPVPCGCHPCAGGGRERRGGEVGAAARVRAPATPAGSERRSDQTGEIELGFFRYEIIKAKTNGFASSPKLRNSLGLNKICYRP